MINKAEAIKIDMGIAAENQRKLRDGRIDQIMEENKSSKSRSKAVRLTNISQTIEFFETRAAKVAGQRNAFKGHVMSESQ